MSDPKSTEIKKDAKEETKKPLLTLEGAVKSGDAVLASDVDARISEALQEQKKAIEKEVRKEMKSKDAAGLQERRTRSVQNFLDGTGLTDVEFGKRLMGMHISKEWARVLRDDHRHFKKDKQIWDYIRQNYKETVKR